MAPILEKYHGWYQYLAMLIIAAIVVLLFGTQNCAGSVVIWARPSKASRKPCLTTGQPAEKDADFDPKQLNDAATRAEAAKQKDKDQA